MTEEKKHCELERRLHQLREENAARWRRIEALHSRQHEAVESEANATPLHPSQRMLSYLKTETALVPENGVYQECDRLLEQLEQLSPSSEAAAQEQRDMYATEMVDSFHQLVQTNQLLAESIQRERQKLDAMETSVAELTEIKRVLSPMQSEQPAEELGRQSAGVSSTDPVAMEEDVIFRQEDEEKRRNQQLKDDLSYLARCLDKQSRLHVDGHQPGAPSAPENSTATSIMGLDEFVLELLDRLLSSPDDPYLSVDEDSRIRPDHVDLLKNCWMVQAFKDDESLIRLFDYHIQ